MSENTCKLQADLLSHSNPEYFWNIDPFMLLFKLIEKAYPMQMITIQWQKIYSKFYVFDFWIYLIAKYT